MLCRLLEISAIKISYYYYNYHYIQIQSIIVYTCDIIIKDDFVWDFDVFYLYLRSISLVSYHIRYKTYTNE